MRPWHAGDLFFQEAPSLGEVDLDALYKGKDPVKLSQVHYESMGMQVKDIVARSDLYEKKGKNPHAFCIDIDRDQDIRVLCNVKPDGAWMDTMHHELGHGVYDQGISPDVPFLLHEPAHILTTEGMAMLFGAMTRTPDFLRRVVGTTDEVACAESLAALKAEKLIFSRWAQVMLRFERGLYCNPEQDLNKLWWDLKARYQNLAPPQDRTGADYAAKLHIVSAPVYYHNYLLGDLFASQVWSAAARKRGVDKPLDTCFFGDPEAGLYLRSVFTPGNLNSWRDLTRTITGEALNPDYYTRMYVGGVP